MPENEAYSTSGIATSGGGSSVSDVVDIHPQMTNEDFRKLLMTPRAPPSQVPLSTYTKTKDEKAPPIDDKGDRRKRKKSFYATLKKQEEDKMAELARKYRDRARERREGANPDYQNDDPICTMAGYRAVAPDAKSGLDAAERRRQMIQESKFLGGDMEHTHLVKGLDYALLQKVRSEISNKEREEEELEEVIKVKTKDRDEEEDYQVEFKTKYAKNIFRAVFKSRAIDRNELFLPGRLAYVIDLEDEFADSDIPTTLVRSKADCPSVESQTTLTTNDIVINKLTQILSYLRQGTRNSKKIKKKEKGKSREEEKSGKPIEESIYGDIGEYFPSAAQTISSKDSHGDRDKISDKEKSNRHSYFEKPGTEDDHDQVWESSTWEKYSSHPSGNWSEGKSDREKEAEASALVHSATVGLASLPKREESKSRSSKLLKKLTEPDSYAECYPGAPETADAIEDSDDEVDYTKMDMGNKKGPIGRWDFDTQEEYSDYMNQKEALPKAAFQYGVKMADGRKTRRTVGKKDEKAELDREWQKISQIIAKRKTTGEDGREGEYKIPKY